MVTNRGVTTASGIHTIPFTAEIMRITEIAADAVASSGEQVFLNGRGDYTALMTINLRRYAMGLSRHSKWPRFTQNKMLNATLDEPSAACQHEGVSVTIGAIHNNVLTIHLLHQNRFAIVNIDGGIAINSNDLLPIEVISGFDFRNCLLKYFNKLISTVKFHHDRTIRVVDLEMNVGGDELSLLKHVDLQVREKIYDFTDGLFVFQQCRHVTPVFTVEFFCMAQHKHKRLKLNTHNDLDNL